MMKKKGRSQTSNRKLTAGETGKICEKETKLPGSRGRRRKTATNSSRNISSLEEATATDDVQKPKAVKFRSSGRLGTAICRLCHGKFSPRSLRHAFQWAQNVVEESDSVAPSPLLFHTFHVDFQQLVGVPLDRDPRLSEFVCKKCHTKFYKCHSILIRFLQRVNLPPVGKENIMNQEAPNCPDSSQNNCSTTPPCFTSDPKCLHSLVSWAHHHGEACRSCPNLKEVLEGQCLGSVKAVWSCVDGHRYTMDTRQSAAANLRCTLSISGGGGLGGVSGDGVASEEDEQEALENDEDQAGEDRRTTRGSLSTPSSNSPSAVAPQTQSSELDLWTTNTKGAAAPVVSSAAVQLEDRGADSEVSDGVISDNDFDVTRKEGASDDELFEPYSNTRTPRATVSNKRLRIQQVPEEPKIRKKPGPKPGWKNKLQPKREELPYIYKCPYQGCTAVYKSPDVRKKHMKEHHEEVRERPCPHPGCNKVFTIDRYLQRHIKAIHTEERNYICDQCGQTFKQRKHLFVHQLRHTGAKPLQCEVCGFQCRQRASLKYHMTKHKAEADLEFACLICQKRFEKAHNLNVHMSMIHPLTQGKSGGSTQQQPPQQPQQQQQQQQQQPLYDLHTVTLQDQDR